MYQDKLASLKEMMKQLENKTHPEYVRRTEKAKQMYQERLFLNDVILEYEVSLSLSLFLPARLLVTLSPVCSVRCAVRMSLLSRWFTPPGIKVVESVRILEQLSLHDWHSNPNCCHAVFLRWLNPFILRLSECWVTELDVSIKYSFSLLSCCLSFQNLMNNFNCLFLTDGKDRKGVHSRKTCRCPGIRGAKVWPPRVIDRWVGREEKVDWNGKKFSRDHAWRVWVETTTNKEAKKES